MKYVIIGKKFSKSKKGSHIISKRFASYFPKQLDYIKSSDVVSLEELNTQYERIIFSAQAPHLYEVPTNFITLRNINHIIYIRNEHNNELYNSCTNGFHYYLNSDIKHFIPMITDFNAPQPSELCIGFYAKLYRTDTLISFYDFMDNLPFKMKIYTMGDYLPYLENHKNVIEYKHTYDNYGFFSNITHYVYSTPNDFVDPFPHALLEAVQCNKQIIIPTIERKFKDGIDDVKDCIKWHKNFSPDVVYDNSQCILKFENFTNFYKKVLENNFEYNFDKLCYNNYKDWIEREVL